VKEKGKKRMKAVILAAGFGSRLWPLTEDRTKPAIPFLNRPLISYSVDYLASHSIRDIIVNLHHQPESIRKVLGDGSNYDVTIRYSYENQILGTSGALDRVREQLVDEDFVVINGKIVTDIDLTDAIRKHRQTKAIATLVLRENRAREHFSIVEVNDRGLITKFAGFPEAIAVSDAELKVGGPTADPTGAPLMFTGIQVLSPRIFEYIPRDRFSHSTIDVYPKALHEGEVVMAHVTAGEWYEMSTLERYLEASLIFTRKQGLTLVKGRRCVIDEAASVEDSVLWDDVTVDAGARVNRSILGDGVRVPAGSLIDTCAVIRREFAKTESVERGTFIGENLIVPIS
jgi:NDP-sugar pyrophosphorylase family protein